jgi:hypothetical protein
MYGLTRGMATLLGVAVAGVLMWLAAEVFDGGEILEANETGDYWSVVGLLVAAGFVIALSQLLGGWTKWGWPRISAGVFLLGFLPALVAGGWVLLYLHPGGNRLADDVRDWSDDLGIENVVQDLTNFFPAIAFALGLVLGLTLDTSGPRVVSAETARTAPTTRRETVRRRDDDETVVGAGAAADEEPTRQFRRDDDTVVGGGAAPDEDETRRFRRDEETVVGGGAASDEEQTRQFRRDDETVLGGGAAPDEEQTRRTRE